QDVAGALALQRLDQRRHQRLVRRRLARYADDMDIVLDRLAGGFFRRLEQGPDIDVEADIGKGGGDDLGAAVMAVLAELDDQHARAPSLLPREGFDLALDPAEALIILILPAIDADHRSGGGLMAAEHGFERVGNLADRGARPARLDRQRQQIAAAALGGRRQYVKRSFAFCGVAASADGIEAGDLRLAHGLVVDIEDFDMIRLARLIFVDPDDDLFA